MNIVFCLDQQGRILYTNNRQGKFGAAALKPWAGHSFTGVFAAPSRSLFLKRLSQLEQEAKPFQMKPGLPECENGPNKIKGTQRSVSKGTPKQPAPKPAAQQLPAAVQHSLEQMSDALLTLDKDWRYTYLNQKAASMLGFAPAELLGKCIWEVFPGLVNSPFYKAVHRALETQQYTAHTDYAESLGRWLERRIHPSPDGLMIFFSDVSARKEEESKQIQNIQAAVDASSVVSFIDLQGRITWANENYCQISGHTLNELLGKKHSVLEHSFQSDEESESILRTINKGEIWKGEVQGLAKDGQLIWTQTTIVPMRDAAGQVSHHTIFSQDITERKSSAKSIADSERLYRTLIENYSEAVFLTDLQGRIQKVNRLAEVTTALQPDELKGKNFLQFLSAEARQKISTALPVLMEGKNLQFKTVIEHFATPFSAVVAIAPVLIEHTPKYFFVRLKDISTEVNYEKNLKLLNDTTLALSTASTLTAGTESVIRLLCAYGGFQYGECWMPLYGQPLAKLKSSWSASERFQSMLLACKDRTLNIQTDKPEIFSTGKWYFSDCIQENSTIRRRPEAALCGLHSMLTIPLIYRNQLLCLFALYTQDERKHPGLDPDELQALLNKLGGELERRKSNEELDRFFSLSPDLMSILSFDGYTKKTNSAFQQLFGYTEEEIKSIPVLDLVHPDDLQKVKDAWIEAIQGQPHRNLELRYRCKNGDYSWLSCTTQSVVEENLVYLSGRDISEQKLRIQELELIRLGIDNTSDAIGMATDMENAIYVNKSFDKLLGWTLEELNAIGWTKMFVNPQLPYDIVDILIEKNSWEGDIEMYHRNGNILDINLRANAILNHDNTPRYLIGVYRDITEQKKTQLELAKLSTAIKHSINEVYIISPESGRFSYVNARALNNLGYTQPEIGTLRPLKINPEYASFHYRKMFALLISGRKKALHFQTYHTRKDGSRYPVEIHLSPFQFKQEHAIMASVTDITERLQAEEELRISHERYQLVTRATNDAIWDFDQTNQTCYYGEGFRTLFGHDYGESFAGMEVWAENIHYQDAERVIGNFHEVVIHKAKEWVIEYRFRCADGSYKFVKERGYVIYDAGGNAVRMTAALSDITEQKYNEALLQEFNNELEQKVEEKTASLAHALRIKRQEERARIETEKVLQQSLQEKEVLIKEIHHRVKNNMAIISGLLSLQARQAKNDELKSILKDSQSRIKSMALIHELLYQNQNLARINFKDYIYELVAGISTSFHSLDKDITIQIEAEAAELSIVHAVPCALILNELITNCYKYAFAEKSDGCIFIDYKKEIETHKLTVADNGIGLPADYNLRKTKSLGMQLIGSLVRQIGGEMTIDTSAGAKFTFTWKE